MASSEGASITSISVPKKEEEEEEKKQEKKRGGGGALCKGRGDTLLPT